MLRLYAGERTEVLQSKLVYRGYDLEVRRVAPGWRVGIYPRTADLPILGRCEVFAAAERVTANDHGLLTNLLVGIAGSFVGGWLAQLMNFQFENWLGNLLVAAVGAVLVLWLWRFATARSAA